MNAAGRQRRSRIEERPWHCKNGQKRLEESLISATCIMAIA